MGVLARVLGAVRSLFGGSEEEADAADASAESDSTTPDADGSDEGPTKRRCSVCGTEVDPDDDTCPLCGSTDPSADADSGQSESPGTESVATDGAETDAAAERLRELRSE